MNTQKLLPPPPAMGGSQFIIAASQWVRSAWGTRQFLSCLVPRFCDCQRGLISEWDKKCLFCYTDERVARSEAWKFANGQLSLTTAGLICPSDIENYWGRKMPLAERRELSTRYREFLANRELTRATRRGSQQSNHSGNRVVAAMKAKKSSVAAAVSRGDTVWTSGGHTYRLTRIVIENRDTHRYSKSWHRQYGPAVTIESQRVSLQIFDIRIVGWRELDRETIQIGTRKQIKDASDSLISRNPGVFENPQEIK